MLILEFICLLDVLSFLFKIFSHLDYEKKYLWKHDLCLQPTDLVYKRLHKTCNAKTHTPLNVCSFIRTDGLNILPVRLTDSLAITHTHRVLADRVLF